MRANLHEIKPIISIFLIITSLLLIVFLKMEERRMGYDILMLTREHRHHIEEKRDKIILLAKITRPQLIEKLAHQSKYNLRRVRADQIIHSLPILLNDLSKDQNKEIN